MSATIDAMPCAHVSNLTVRTMLNAYNITLYIIENVKLQNGSVEAVIQAIEKMAKDTEALGDMFYEFVKDGDMADYMYFLANELGWFSCGDMACDGSYIRYHYSIGV